MHRESTHFIACFLHYNFSIKNTTMQFLGNNYTGAYLNKPRITNALHHHRINEKLIANYFWVIAMGCPNHFSTHTTRSKTLLYWCQGNHPSIITCIDKVMTAMNKEECNNILYVLHWLWRFVPHCFITRQHFLIKPRKKD